MNLESFKALLLDTCGFTFINDRENTLNDGIVRRMAALKIVSSSEYYRLLVHNQAEMGMLTELLTVNETYFFREPEQLRLVTDRLIPELIKKRDELFSNIGKSIKKIEDPINTRHAGKIKILSAGCSTGEEPYSIAIFLHERYGIESQNCFSIIGADIDTAAVSSAINGVYGKYSFRAMDNSLRERYFEPFNTDSLNPESRPSSICSKQPNIKPKPSLIQPNSFRIKEFIKKQVTFQTANLNADNYPPIMWNSDIIFYRNVSIYFPKEIQQAIFSRLANNLKTGGYLIVSSTETLHHNTGILSLMEIDNLFVYKKEPSICVKERNHAKSKILNTLAPEPLKSTPLIQTSLISTSTLSTQKSLISTPTPLTQTSLTSKPEVLIPTPSTPPIYLSSNLVLAKDFIDAKRLTEAESICLDAVSQDEFSIAAYLMLGIIAYQSGRNEEGLKRCREALYLDSTCWAAHFYLAETANMLGDKKRAASAYKSALDILEQENLYAEHQKKYFPLEFNIEQFKVVCRHKLNILRKAV